MHILPKTQTFKGTYPFMPYNQQAKQPSGNIRQDFKRPLGNLYPPADLLQATMITGMKPSAPDATKSAKTIRDLKDQFYREGDVYSLAKLYDLSKTSELLDFGIQVQNMAYDNLGIEMVLSQKFFIPEFLTRFYEFLDFQKKLGTPLPDSIRAYTVPVTFNSKGVLMVTMGRNDIRKKLPNRIISEIYLNDNIFSDQVIKRYFTDKNNQPDMKKLLNALFTSICHELGHTAHGHNDYNKLNSGDLTLILTTEEKSVYNRLVGKYREHYPEIKRLLHENTPAVDCFKLNSEYYEENDVLNSDFRFNMRFLKPRWELLLKALSDPALSPEAQKDFNPEFMAQIKPVMNKLCSAIELIRNNFREYSLLSAKEIVADATAAELTGYPGDSAGILNNIDRLEPILTALGKPKPTNLSYLPKDYFKQP